MMYEIRISFLCSHIHIRGNEYSTGVETAPDRLESVGLWHPLLTYILGLNGVGRVMRWGSLDSIWLSRYG